MSSSRDMSKPKPPIRRDGAYIIKSAASRPYEIKGTASPNGHAPVVTPEIKQLVAAVWQHARS
jgi:hypothetical protein